MNRKMQEKLIFIGFILTVVLMFPAAFVIPYTLIPITAWSVLATSWVSLMIYNIWVG